MMPETIPFSDINALHLELEEEMVAVFRKTLQSGRFIGGPRVEEFEREFANFCNTRFCVGVGSGTDALRFSLMASGVKANDLVITVPNTFIATTEAITQSGASPVFLDIDEQTYNLSVDKLRDYLQMQCTVDHLTGKTKEKRSGRPVTAVIPVHLYGQTADMDSILELAETFRLIVIEDACQAHGAEYFSKKQNRWCKAGSMGKTGAFSFYPGKNLGAMGEGGAVTTNDENIAKQIQMLRDHGQSHKYIHDMEGYNGRLDALQADILRVKLSRLAGWNEKRRLAAKRYDRLFSTENKITIPFTPEWARPIYHLYVIRAPKRDSLKDYLAERSIETGLHYPVPLHLQNAYRDLSYAKQSFPVSEQAASEILSLPMFPTLTESQQEQVVDCIIEHLYAGHESKQNHWNWKLSIQ